MSGVINSTLSEAFGIFLKVLADAIGYRCSRLTCGLTQAQLARIIPILGLFHRRVLRHARRFRRFAEAEDPASLNPKRRRSAQQPDQPKPARIPPAVSLPRRFGWLREMIPDPAAFPGAGQAAAYLLMVLRDPACKALLEICPTLARDLRPLCHALGIRHLSPGVPLPFPPRAPRKPDGEPTAEAPKPTPPKAAPPQPRQPQPRQPPASRRVFLDFSQKTTA